MTDPIADMLARIQNALLAGHSKIEIPHSKIKQAIARILQDNDYIESFEVMEQKPQAVLELKLGYKNKWPKITGIKRISKPGRRLYAGVDRIPAALNGYGITIISTSKGLLTDSEAKKENVGGELLCQVW
ncbi:MAG TPA: 30S ribosomal protein S8 [Patescibacteria group bacterium]|jgi:small subunit ribosomal protein S8